MKTLRNLPVAVLSKLVQTKSIGGLNMSDDIEVLAIGAPADIRPGFTTARNTMMKIRSGDFVTHIAFDRVSASTFYTSRLANNPTGMVITKPDGVVSIKDIFKDFTDYIAQDFEEHEWLDVPLVINPNNTITFTASPTNYWFTGSMDVRLDAPTVIVDGRPIVKITPDVRDLTALNKYNSVTNGVELGMLVYDLDYGDFTNDLLMMDTSANVDWYLSTPSQSDAQNTLLAQILASVDGRAWTYNKTTPSLYNIYGGGVIYNGDVDNFYSILTQNTYTDNHQFDGPGLMTRDMQRPRKDKQFVMVYLINGATGTAKAANYCYLFIHYGPDRGPDYYEQEDKPPVHHWPLAKGSRANHGLSNDPFGPCGTVTEHLASGWPTMILNKQGNTTYPPISPHYIGPKLPVNVDFTLSFKTWVTGNAASGAQYMLAIYKAGSALQSRGNMGAITEQNWQPLGTWPLIKEMPGVCKRVSPHRATITFVRRGALLYLYIDGLLSQIASGESEIDYVDVFRHYNTDQQVALSDFYYFDYALNSKQVRKMIAGDMDLDKTFPVYQPAPEPLHYWPLNGVLDNLGTSKQAINGVFDWKQVGSEMWAARTSGGGGQALGVSLPIDVDFTFQFDFYSAGTVEYGSLLSGPDVTVSHDGALKLYAGMFYINGSEAGVLPIATHRVSATRKHTWTIVHRNGAYYTYIDGVQDRCFRRGAQALVNVTEAWTHFGRAPEYLNVADRTRNWKYWDVALTDEQVLVESYKGKK